MAVLEVAEALHQAEGLILVAEALAVAEVVEVGKNIINKGALAQLARALHWQCRGQRFESVMLHKK